MKKLIILTILALTLSCSKENGPSVPVSNEITTSTLLGFWQPSYAKCTHLGYS